MDDALDVHSLNIDTTRRAAQTYDVVSTLEMADALTHTFTHFRLQIHLLRAEVAPSAAPGGGQRWMPPA